MASSVLLRLTLVELRFFLTNIRHFFFEFHTVHLDIYMILYPGKLNKKYLHAFSESFDLKKNQIYLLP